MKKIAFVILVSLLFNSCASLTDTNRYFDQNSIEISKDEFDKKVLKRTHFEVPGDSATHKKLVARENRGTVKAIEKLHQIIAQDIPTEIDFSKPLVVVYYPGKDPCNASARSDAKFIRSYYKIREDGVWQLAATKPIYIYKENTGMEKYKNIVTWYQDPQGIFERLFFKHHYPCDSFVVIAPNGKYISYFGEFSKEYLWEAVQIMAKE